MGRRSVGQTIYLIGCTENNVVKIGRTRDLKCRFSAIQRMSPVKLELLWHIEGAGELEQTLHHAFRARRLHGEWFDFAGDNPVELVKAAIAGDFQDERLCENSPARKMIMQHGPHARPPRAGSEESYNELVENARLIRHFETAHIPSLLQTPDYARMALKKTTALHDLDAQEVSIDTALFRQQGMLYDTGKHFEFLLAEPALRWMVGSSSVMRGQLGRLQTLVGLERIRFGILPMGVQLSTAPRHSFQIFVTDDPVVTVGTLIGATHRGDKVSAYGRILDRLWDDAVTGERARERIIAAMQALPSASVSEATR